MPKKRKPHQKPKNPQKTHSLAGKPGLAGKRHSPTPPTAPSTGAPARPKTRTGGRSSRPKTDPWIYGTHATRAALANPARTCRRLVVTSSDQVSKGAHGQAVEAEIVTRDVLSSLLPEGAVHQGIAVLADPLAARQLDEICGDAPEDALVLVLDQITDPRNLGAILRNAAAFSAHAVIVQDRHAPPITGIVAKAASGALEPLTPIPVTNLARSLEKLADAGFWRLGLDGAAPRTIVAARPQGGWRRTALVLGAEGKGLRPRVAQSCDELVAIPMAADPRAGIDSLNVASAAAVALYELRRK